MDERQDAQLMLSFLIRDTADIIQRVNNLAEKEGTSRAAIYRRAIRMLLSQEGTDANHHGEHRSASTE